MSRAPARFTEADIRRAIRAARKEGAGLVRVLPDSTITIDPQPTITVEADDKALAKVKEIIL